MSQIIKSSRNPSFSIEGVFAKRPSAASLKKCIKDETQRIIWINAFDDLELMNRHFVTMMPLLIAYSRELAMYQLLTESAGDKIIDNYRGDDRINPELVQANRCLKNAMDLFKLLGLDPVTKNRLGRGPEKIEALEADEFDDLV